MRWKLLNADPPVTYAIALQTDEEVMLVLDKFIHDHEIEAASVTAIGAFSQAVLGYFDWNSKRYKETRSRSKWRWFRFSAMSPWPNRGRCSTCMLCSVKRMAAPSAGVSCARVRPTLEVILTQPPSYMRKRYDPKTGLKLPALDPA